MATLEKNELQRILNFIKPALSQHDFVPVLTHFCFTEHGEVYAYNDLIGVTVREQDFGILGAIPGKDLLKVISAFPKQEINIEEVDEGAGVLLKSGRSKTKLAMLQPEDFLYEPITNTAATPLAETEVTEEMLSALKKLVTGIGDDGSSPAQMGVTITPNAMYSTDNITITAYELEEAIEGIDQVIVPKSFVELVCELSKFNKAEIITLAFYGDNVTAILEDESVEITTRIINDEDPFNFEGLVDGMLSEAEDLLVKIPTEFKDMFQRAEGILGKNDEVPMELVIWDGNMQISAKSDKIEFNDDCDVDCDDIKFLASPALINRACNFTSHMAFMEQAMLFSDGARFHHLVSHDGE